MGGSGSSPRTPTNSWAPAHRRGAHDRRVALATRRIEHRRERLGVSPAPTGGAQGHSRHAEERPGSLPDHGTVAGVMADCNDRRVGPGRPPCGGVWARYRIG